MKLGTMARGTGTLALSAVLAAGGFAQKTTVSDAEVQATLLKAFAADTRLATEPISTSTAFGNVTLSGAVSTDAERDAADKIASTTKGVRKVIDQLRVGEAAVATARTAATSASTQQADAQGGVDDGSAQPTTGAVSDAELEAQQYGIQRQPGGGASSGAPNGSASQAAVQNASPQEGAPAGVAPNGGGLPQSRSLEDGAPTASYPQAGVPESGSDGYSGGQGQGYPQRNGPDASRANAQDGPQNNSPRQGRLYRRDYERQLAERNGTAVTGASAVGYGQRGGQPVTIPNGTVLNVRINRWISSGDAEPGSTFTAIVATDVTAGGLIAIPRGATVAGNVVDAQGAGALKGRGSLTLQLTALTLGGRTVPLASDPFTVNGRDKAAQSVGSTIVGGALGAIIGGAVGGGAGAAIGAGLGGAAGLGTSAASGGGQAVLPSEALLHFRLVQPADVTTVSEAEMQRLGQYAGPARPVRPAPYGPYAYPGAYPYPGPYGPYPAYFYGRPYFRGGYFY